MTCTPPASRDAIGATRSTCSPLALRRAAANREDLASHRSLAELFKVLADHLHSVVRSTTALVLYDESTDEMRVVILSRMTCVPFTSTRVADLGGCDRLGPNASSSPSQRRDARFVLAFIRSQGRACWLPLTTARRKLGVLSFGSCMATAYHDDILAFMEQVAAMVAIAVDNGINYDQAQRYQRELREDRDHQRFLLEVNNLLVSQLDYRGLLNVISEAVQRVIDADQIGVALYDEESAQLRLNWMYDKAHGFTRSDTVLALDESVAGLTFQRGAAGVFRRADLEGREWAGAALMKAHDVESVCCVPLVTRNGTVGALYAGSPSRMRSPKKRSRCSGIRQRRSRSHSRTPRAYEQLTILNAHLIDEKQYWARAAEGVHRDHRDQCRSAPGVEDGQDRRAHR